MKKIYNKPQSTSISLICESALLGVSTDPNGLGVNKNEYLNASDAYSNKKENSGPWGGQGIWDNMQ